MWKSANGDVRGRLVEFDRADRRREWESTLAPRLAEAVSGTGADGEVSRLMLERIHELERSTLEMKRELDSRIDADAKKARKMRWAMAALAVVAGAAIWMAF